MRVNVSMKHPGEYSAWDYCLRQRKRLKHATLPRSLCALPHVMKRIDLFAMSLEDAAVEAAATNDIDRLRSILDHIKINEYRDDVGRDGTDVAAAKGYTEIIKLISAEALEAAVTKGEYNISRICEHNKIPGKIFYGRRSTTISMSSMMCTISTILTIWTISKGSDGVLYAHDTGCEDDTHAVAFCAAAAYGPLEMVKMIYDNDNENFDESTLGKAFASAAGNSQLETMTHLQSLQTFDQEAIDKAFVVASRNGKMDAVKTCATSRVPDFCCFSRRCSRSAASGGHLEMLKFLNTKGRLSRKVMTNAFENSIKAIGVLSEARNDQVRVLKFLHRKGQVYPEVIDELFPEAASCCSLAAVEFLHSTGFISTDSVTEAFHNAARETASK
ncbi:Ankyrin repeat-containing domain [Phytophthora cactorum]|nr:Ankyrin repeat-containing domain [Phytophthora cactorum]